jgi:hypothetical protein
LVASEGDKGSTVARGDGAFFGKALCHLFRGAEYFRFELADRTFSTADALGKFPLREIERSAPPSQPFTK